MCQGNAKYIGNGLVLEFSRMELSKITLFADNPVNEFMCKRELLL